MFHQQFPQVKISHGRLYSIYRRHGIKNKTIKLTKILTARKERRLIKSKVEVLEQIR